MGADRAVHAWDPAFEGSDTLATARVLAAIVGKLRADVVITGGRTADRRAATVGPMLAQILHVPAVTFIKDAELDGRKLMVKKQLREKVGTFEVPLPALLSVSDEYPRARVATAWGVADAYRTGEVTQWNRRDLDLHEESVGRAGSPTRVRRMEKIRAQRRDKVECEFFEGDAEDVARDFVRRLRARGVVR
jgi:electron transfer flavoprotein beta subunit